MRRQPDTIKFWANRFGELSFEKDPDFPGTALIDNVVTDLYPTTSSMACEMVHVVSVDGVLGLWLEYEFDERRTPSPMATGMWYASEVPGCRFFCFDGPWNYDDNWVFAAFIPLEIATPARIEQCNDLIWFWGGKA